MHQARVSRYKFIRQKPDTLWLAWHAGDCRDSYAALASKIVRGVTLQGYMHVLSYQEALKAPPARARRDLCAAAAQEIRRQVLAGEGDSRRLGQLVDVLLSAQVSFKERLIGGGPWVVVRPLQAFLRHCVGLKVVALPAGHCMRGRQCCGDVFRGTLPCPRATECSQLAVLRKSTVLVQSLCHRCYVCALAWYKAGMLQAFNVLTRPRDPLAAATTQRHCNGQSSTTRLLHIWSIPVVPPMSTIQGSLSPREHSKHRLRRHACNVQCKELHTGSHEGRRASPQDFRPQNLAFPPPKCSAHEGR